MRCSSCPSLRVCQIEYPQSALPRVLDGIGRAARLLCEVADTDAAVVYHVAVALVHTAGKVMLREADHLVGAGFDLLIPRFLLRAPPRGLVAARDDDDETDVAALPAPLDHGLGCEGVETQSAPDVVGFDAHVSIEVFNAVLDALRQFL